MSDPDTETRRTRATSLHNIGVLACSAMTALSLWWLVTDKSWRARLLDVFLVGCWIWNTRHVPGRPRR